MTTRECQVRFTHLVPELIREAERLGFEPIIAEVQRSASQAALNAKVGTGISNSLHIDKLAIDLLLFRHGLYLTDTIDYRQLGMFWLSLDPGCRWGGTFRKPDGNHFSFSPDGLRA